MNRKLRSPFLSLVEAAFFLQIPMYRAQVLHEAGELPEPVAVDGTVFRPSRTVLVDALALREQLPPAARDALDAWQRGELEIPRPPRRNAKPIALAQVVASAQRERIDERSRRELPSSTTCSSSRK